MNKGHIYFEIQADDPVRAVSFYSKVFGWKFDEVKGLPVPYWRIETGGSRGGLLKRPAKTPPTQCGTNAFVCSLEVEDFDETAKIIEQLGGVVALSNSRSPRLAGRAISSMPRGIDSESSRWMRTRNKLNLSECFHELIVRVDSPVGESRSAATDLASPSHGADPHANHEPTFAAQFAKIRRTDTRALTLKFFVSS